MKESNHPHSVHIIPLGYEIDRAIRPFDSEKAVRVYLLTMKQMEKYNSPEEIQMTARERHYESRVSDILTEKGIQVITKQIDMFNTLEVMREVASIINHEKKQNSVIKVNMSACGRITAFATTLAAMAHDVSLYYVRADKYADSPHDVECHGLSICEQQRIWNLEKIPLALPDKTKVTVLSLLAGKKEGLFTWEIVDYLIQSGEYGYDIPFREKHKDEMRMVQRRYHTRLNKSTLEPLITSGYITKKKVGRFHRIKITQSGLYLAAVHGAYISPEFSEMYS
ncbi:DUF6293 family protein [Methanospirillum hungatei]|uniref:HFX_2341 family transcriptional regulator domain-containing protein n=1 Tax=Methanospirillum hungatei TaxID=2203 RepID=UPI0026F2B018|nr:DUF6293 family protein [Methanospirillum hungatei]MCA1916463.1 DUF6293 family protein [Methanospirillum hungatei]